MKITAALLTAASAVLWGIVIANMWVTVPERVLYVVNPALITVTIIAALCWVTGGNRSRDDRVRRHDRREDVYLDTIERFTRPSRRPTSPTGPLRRVQ